MKKSLFLLIIILVQHSAKAQLTKGNWLVGGSAGLTTANFFRSSGDTGRSTSIILAPSIGYFLATRFAAGLRLTLTKYVFTEHQFLTGNLSEGNDFGIAFDPFIRYYILKDLERRLNVFAEGSTGYGYSMDINSDYKHILNRFSISAGAVYFFNNSVGLEYTLGYYRSTQFGQTANSFQTRIGLQIHLEKEKK